MFLRLVIFNTPLSSKPLIALIVAVLDRPKSLAIVFKLGQHSLVTLSAYLPKTTKAASSVGLTKSATQCGTIVKVGMS